MLKNWWKYSSIRFYVLNAKFNYGFWLKSKKKFDYIKFNKPQPFKINTTHKIEKITKKRFVGYEYEGEVYLDNPGFKIKNRDVWENWKKKGLI